MSKRLAWAVGALFAVSAAGCGVSAPNTPCTPMNGPSPLVTGAALLRLDVYAAGTACAGVIIAPGAGAPLLSHSFKPGEKVSLSIPNGPHTVVLTTFSDAAGAVELGSVCQMVTIQPGGSLCLDLTVEPAPDLGPPDAAMDLAMTCTGPQCPCAHDGDCKESSRPRCSPGGLCVPCVPTNDNCPSQEYCTASFACSSGCKDDPDCAGATGGADGGATDGGAPSATPFCNTTRHSCVQCISANDCATGQLCSPSGACVQGCDLSMGKGCPGTLTCCNKLCVDTRSDPLNCSACGMACTGASTQCCNSVCSDPNSDALNCGGCGKPCSTVNATPHCGAGGVCSWTCASTFAHCASGNSGCETGITTTSNCGGCGTTCANPNGTTTCTFNGTSGGCVPTCDSTHALCGGNPNTGCLTSLTTTSNCGACGTVCQQVGGTNACTYNGSTGGCVPSCDSTHGVCGGNPNSGCLVPLTTVSNCKTCGAACTNSNGTTSCTWNGTTGGCTPSCTAPFGDCDGMPNNGCETNTSNSTSHCGGCNRPCSNSNVATPNCSGGLCNSTCVSPTINGNCTTPAFPTADNGCETNFNTDPGNCGACGRACSAFNVATAQCSAGLCTSSCSGVHANCTMPAQPTADNGCECNGTACCSGACQTPHSMNGFGSTYYSCVATSGTPGTPNGTNCAPGTAIAANYTQQMADDAAAQYAGQPGTVLDGFTCTIGTDTLNLVCKSVDVSGATGTCTCWAYAGTGNQQYAVGHVYQSTGGTGDKGCFCPTCLANSWN